jgi:hypothetical protein
VGIPTCSLAHFGQSPIGQKTSKCKMSLRILVYVPPFFSNHHGNTRTHETEGGGRGGRTHAHLSVPNHTPA